MGKVTTRQLICLGVLLALIVLVGCLVFVLNRHDGDPEVAEPVVLFLNEFLDPNYSSTEEHSVFASYFAEWDAEDPDALETTFVDVMKLWSPGYRSFELEAVSDNFCIVRLYTEDGEFVAPPIGFWYTITADGLKIDNWEICRLQPFSRYDEEFSVLWEGLYGYS